MLRLIRWGGEGGYNRVAKIASFVEFKEEVMGWNVRIGINRRGYVILGGTRCADEAGEFSVEGLTPLELNTFLVSSILTPSGPPNSPITLTLAPLLSHSILASLNSNTSLEKVFKSSPQTPPPTVS